MIQRCFLTALLLTCLTVTAIAVPDQDNRFQSVLAVYHFQDATDSGPRGLDGLLLKDASIVGRGKRGKCLRLKKDGYFGVQGRDKPVNMTNGKFSILAWVRLPVQPFYFSFEVICGREKIPVGRIRLSIEPSGNLRGVHRDLEALKRTVIRSENENVADNQWHQIAYTKDANGYMLFIDGEVVKTQRSEESLGFLGRDTFIFIASHSPADLTGSVYVDEVGFFETGFSVFEIQKLYAHGLDAFLETMPVDPQKKVSTTWGEIKRRY
jgi:hypothetical protein